MNLNLNLGRISRHALAIASALATLVLLSPAASLAAANKGAILGLPPSVYAHVRGGSAASKATTTPKAGTPVTTAPAASKPATTTPATIPTTTTPASAIPPTSTVPSSTTPTVTAPATATPAGGGAAGARPPGSTTLVGVRKPATHHTRLSTGALALAALGALLALGALVWVLGRWLALEPRWTVSLMHSLREASYRGSATWAEFTDWTRLGH